MSIVRDKLWMWGHEAGSHDAHFAIPKGSRMTPVESCFYFGIPNLIMVAYQGQPAPPFTRHAIAMRPLKQVVWSIIGDSGSKRHNQKTDLDEVKALTGDFPNVTGAMMDDFFVASPDGVAGRYSADQIGGFQKALHAPPRPLDLWVVAYDFMLHPNMTPYFSSCDVVSFWTWKAPDLANLETNFARLERLAPRSRKVLGVYMFDYGINQPMPLGLMKKQCGFALEALRAGRIDGVIVLASCICDLDLEAVEWTRRWVAEVGDQSIG